MTIEPGPDRLRRIHHGQRGAQNRCVSERANIGTGNAARRPLDGRPPRSILHPVRLNRHSEPQPDFAILKPRDDYRKTLPRPEDTMLAVEVANTSLEYDRKVKLALYARGGIPEVWIVNLAAEEVEVHRSPAADHYTSVTRAGHSDDLTIEALPGVLIPVVTIFA